jgi:hypothetical protein
MARGDKNYLQPTVPSDDEQVPHDETNRGQTARLDFPCHAKLFAGDWSAPGWDSAAASQIGTR